MATLEDAVEGEHLLTSRSGYALSQLEPVAAPGTFYLVEVDTHRSHQLPGIYGKLVSHVCTGAI